jgi:arabinoxylan arabinofuranohydrolase
MRLMKKGFAVIGSLFLMLTLFNSVAIAAANANPTWYVDDPVIFHGQAKPYDYYGAKDPTVVYYGGKYHVFYTGANQSGGWQMLYTSASTISGLKNARRTFMSSIGESYFCAPQVFYYEPKGLWYLVYQDGTHGAAYATTTNIADPGSWSGPKSFGISGNMGWDYYIVCDNSYAYMYNSPSDGSGNVYVRKTSLANFPRGWSAPTVAIKNSFEGAHVYKSLADGKYYLIIEDQKDGRYYELWTSTGAGGPWTQVAEKWAWRGNLSYNGSRWTTNVSHGEFIRAGYNQKMEINDINKVDFLIQGSTNLNLPYQKIIWDLGIIRNYSGNSGNSGSKVECEGMTLEGQYAGKISSPFSGVALYANNDLCKYTQYFANSTHSFSIRACSNNSNTATVDLKIGGQTVGTFKISGSNPAIYTINNVSHGTGAQEIQLVVSGDNGTWDAYLDYLDIK